MNLSRNCKTLGFKDMFVDVCKYWIHIREIVKRFEGAVITRNNLNNILHEINLAKNSI